MSRYDLALEVVQTKVGRSESFKLTKTLLVSMVLLISTVFPTLVSAADIYDLQKSGDVELIAWVGENQSQAIR